MRPITKTILSLGCATAMLVSAGAPAYAACKQFSLSVNHYGMEGPTRDAKLLLDKRIADWTERVSLKRYKVVKKSVSCELPLNFRVFDEHTCKATAKVCWSGVSYEVLKARAIKNPQKKTITLAKPKKSKSGAKKVAKKSSKSKTTTKQRKASSKRKPVKKVDVPKPIIKPQRPTQKVAPQRSEPAVQVVKVKPPSAAKQKSASISTGSVTASPSKPSSEKISAAKRAAIAIANARAAAQAAAAAAQAAAAAARAAEAAAKLVEQTK